MYFEENNHNLFQDINRKLSGIIEENRDKFRHNTEFNFTKKQCVHIPIFPEKQLGILYRRTTVSHCIKQALYIYIKLQGTDGIILKPGRQPHGSPVDV
jgi:hypothetical protein